MILVEVSSIRKSLSRLIFFNINFQYAGIHVRILTKTASDIVSFKVRNRVIG